MKIEFDDKSYIECKKSDTHNKVIIVISAKDINNKLKRVTNSVEIDLEQFKALYSSIY